MAPQKYDAESQSEGDDSQHLLLDSATVRTPRSVTAVAMIGFALLVLCGVAYYKPALLSSAPPLPVSWIGDDGASELQQKSEAIVQCPGSMDLGGIGDTQVVNAKVGHLGQDAGQMHIEGGAMHLHMEGRAYFADQCTDGSYNNQDYKSIPLLGQTVQFTVDLSGASCGCNVAFYFVSMKQNSDPSKCEDFYCDANSVCGVACTEVDIMEANNRVWRSTLHLQEDPVGSAAGFGGTGPHTQTWTANEYGPGATCIDTNKPFEVHAHFPTEGGGKFQGMMIDLKQEGMTCGGLTASVGWYHFQQADVLEKMGKFLKEGMVPVVSYWKSDHLQWLDGADVSGEHPCMTDTPLECPLVGPTVSNIQYRPFTSSIHKSTMHIDPTPEPPVDAYGIDATEAAAYDAGAYDAGAYDAGAYGADAYGADAYGAGAYGADAYGGAGLAPVA